MEAHGGKSSLGVVSKRRSEAAGATSHSKRKIIFSAASGSMPDKKG